MDRVSDVGGQGERGRGDEVDFDFVVLQQLDQRMHGAAVFEVAGKSDCDVAYAAQFLADCEEVQKGLGRVLEAAVSAVDDGDGGVFGGDSRRGVVGVSQDDGVAVAAEGADGVL